jgi:hypothetical protein
MPRTRKVVFAAAIVLAVLLILLIWLWPRGRHEGPAVVEITIKATDTLTLGINVDRGKTLVGEVVISRQGAEGVLLGEAVLAALEQGQGDQTVTVTDGVRKPADIGVIVVERIEYGGEGRDGTAMRVILAGDLPNPPAHSAPSQLTLGLSDSPADLYDVLPWPETISWRLTSDDVLEVQCGSQRMSLAPGQAGTLKVPAADVRVRITEVDDTAEIPDGDNVELPIVKKDLGPIRFTSEISIRYLGRLPIVEGSE